MNIILLIFGVIILSRGFFGEGERSVKDMIMGSTIIILNIMSYLN